MRTESSTGLQAAALGLALLGMIVGCSDSTAPEPLPTISGTVITTDSLAVSGAAILVSYRPSYAQLLPKPGSEPAGREGLLQPTTISPDSVLEVFVTDICGDTVRIVCDGDCPDTGLIWDGRDEDGLRLMEGFYFFHIVLPETTLIGKVFVVPGYQGWDPADGRAHAWTDGQGHFSLSDECLSFGEELVVTGPDSTAPADTIPITRVIDLYAVHPDGRQARLESITFPEKGTLDVNLEIPD